MLSPSSRYPTPRQPLERIDPYADGILHAACSRPCLLEPKAFCEEQWEVRGGERPAPAGRLLHICLAGQAFHPGNTAHQWSCEDRIEEGTECCLFGCASSRVRQ